MSESSDINPFEYLVKAVSGWKIILSAGIFFAILGVFVSSIMPAVFQASSVLQVDIDYKRAAPLDDVTVMKAYERVRGVLLADDVLEEAILAAQEEAGPSNEFSEIAAMRERIRVSQRPDGWELVVYSHAPEQAAVIANAWAESSIQALEAGLLHSMKAWEWQGALYSAHCSLEVDPADESRAIWSCSTTSEGFDPDSISDAILEEVRLTRGILPMFSFSVLQQSTIPDAPILWQRGTIILIGAVLGLAVGFVWVVGRTE